MSDYKDMPGKTTIAPEVLYTIARLTTLNVDGVSRMAPVPARVDRLFKRSQLDGILIEVEDDSVYADIYIILEGGVNVRDVSKTIQHDVARAISEMVGMRVGRINIHVEDIEYSREVEA
jgi:uncharacterized alkaline shock family protein YloU